MSPTPTHEVEHYLLGLDLQMNGCASRLHAYVMTGDAGVVTRVVNKMVDHAEQAYGPLVLPIILQTKLDAKTAEEVRTALCERMDEVRKVLDKATDFHLTMWEMAIADPWDEVLWELH